MYSPGFDLKNWKKKKAHWINLQSVEKRWHRLNFSYQSTIKCPGNYSTGNYKRILIGGKKPAGSIESPGLEWWWYVEIPGLVSYCPCGDAGQTCSPKHKYTQKKQTSKRSPLSVAKGLRSWGNPISAPQPAGPLTHLLHSSRPQGTQHPLFSQDTV
jgi:hypothetical protein